MNIGYLLKLGRSQAALRSSIRLSVMQTLLRPAAATFHPLTNSKRRIHVELKQKETPAVGSPTENKLKEINFPPFLKWLYGGDFNMSVLTYADVISYDRYYILQASIINLAFVTVYEVKSVAYINDKDPVFCSIKARWSDKELCSSTT